METKDLILRNWQDSDAKALYEMEYAIAAQYRNNGYAMQAVERMLDYGFKEMNLKS